MIRVMYHNESYVLIDCDDSTFFEMKDYFSFFVEGYQYNPKYKYGAWSGKISLLQHDRTLPYGLISYVQKFADNYGHDIIIDDSVKKPIGISQEAFDEWLSKYSIYDGDKIIEPHWYQLDGVYKGITEEKKILNLPTSAGKSLIQGLLSRYYYDHFEGKILIIVPTIQLTTQMRDDLINYRLFTKNDIGILSNKNKPKNETIVVSTWQSAIKQPQEWLEQFGMLLVDECHLATGKSISSITTGLTNCKFKIGLSGSLKDGKANLMQYIGLFGDVYKPVGTAELMDSGQVSRLKINALVVKYPDVLKAKLKRLTYPDEIKVITKFRKRNEFVCKLAIKLAAKENVFVMFRTTKHGEQLVDLIREMGYENVHIVHGKIDGSERDRLKHMVEKSDGMIVVASYGVFSTGISVKKLHHVILAHPVKSKITVLQTIGRVLRKHETKEVAKLWDIIDDMSSTKTIKGQNRRVNINYALKHGLARIERYGSENFDYSLKEYQL